jgi:steroid 5-alpha reductase family enzyme
MIDALLANAGILLALVLLLWLVSVQLGDVSFIDAFWGAGMGVMAITSFAQTPKPGDLALVLLIMTTVWGFRLGLHLFLRWRQDGEDARYEKMLRRDREKGRFAIAALTKVFLGQAVLLFITCLPAQLGILSGAYEKPMTGLAWIGLAVFAVGIFFEVVGDWQLKRFKADPAHVGEVMDKGLWRYTRHPNYFGDACVWWGIWLAAASLGLDVALWSVAGPIFLTFTLTKWSGAPLLEGGMKKRRPKYAEYIERTSGFIPMPPKKKTG